MTPEERARADQVGHALNMIAELPLHTDSQAYPLVVRAACLESYFTNVRLAFEFLAGSWDKDRIQRHDYLAGWGLRELPRARLAKEYGFASENVSHLPRSRVGGGTVTNVAPARLQLLAELILDGFAEFATALAAAGSEYAPLFADYVANARGRLDSSSGASLVRGDGK